MSPGEILAQKAKETWEPEDIVAAIKQLEEEGTLLSAGDTARALHMGELLFTLEDMLTQLRGNETVSG